MGGTRSPTLTGPTKGRTKMLRFLLGKKALAGLAIAGGAALAAVGSAAPALGFFSPPLLLQIHVKSPATLVAKGAGAKVTVKIQCAGAKTATVRVKLTERSGNTDRERIRVGAGGMHEPEPEHRGDGDGNHSTKPFKNGSALAKGVISGCTTKLKVCGNEGRPAAPSRSVNKPGLLIQPADGPQVSSRGRDPPGRPAPALRPAAGRSRRSGARAAPGAFPRCRRYAG